MQRTGVVAWAGIFNASTGCVYYDWAAPIFDVSRQAAPLAPFTSVARIFYLASEDALIATGYTAALPDSTNVWGDAGRWAQRYEGAVRGNLTPGVGWALPWTNHSCGPGNCVVDNAKAIDVVDDLMFVGMVYQNIVVFNATSGAYLGNMSNAGVPEMDSYAGWLDVIFGVAAARVEPPAPGDERTYVLVREEDGRQKEIVYTLHL